MNHKEEGQPIIDNESYWRRKPYQGNESDGVSKPYYVNESME